MDKVKLSDKTKRLSLPVSSKDNFDVGFNRRHTLMPGRGILKSNLEDNNTINIISDVLTKEKRRVSFAPEVTLHKINYATANERRKLKRRSSLTANIKNQETINNDSKLTTSSYLGKIYETSLSKENISENITNSPNKEVLENKPDQFIIDEETQTMEMSIELTNQIKKQQDVIREQITTEEPVQFQPTTHNSLRDLFEEVDQELNDTSELVPKDPHELVQLPELNSDDMEMTETFHLKGAKPIDNKKTTQGFDSTIPITEVKNFNDKSDQYSFITEDDQTMELTQPIRIENNVRTDENDSTENLLEMELTQPILTRQNSAPSIAKQQEEILKIINKDEEETMEFTQPIKTTVEIIAEDKKIQATNEVQIPEPTTLAIEDTAVESLNTAGMTDSPETNIAPTYYKEDFQINLELGETNAADQDVTVSHADEINHSVISDRDTSEMETSLIGTEMVPLAEVTVDLTENADTYESEHFFSDDNYVNISLDVFLNDVNVQFYDNIGPRDNEVEQTLAFTSEARSSISSSPSSVSSSTNSTPSSVSSSTKVLKSNISDFIDACSNIPYYHYLVHLISQYKSSIQSISTMVNTFSNDLLESNPTAIREYYQQTDDTKQDLCTNYQAIATVTRKQTKLQNITFVSGLLEQLSLSYERVNEALEAELSKTLEWRKRVLIDRQKMIEKKVELDQELQKLNVMKDSFASIDMEKFMKNKADIAVYEEKKTTTKDKILEVNELINQKMSIIDEKKEKKQQLLDEIQNLKAEVAKVTIPTTSDLDILTEKLSNLELEKGIKLIDAESQSYLLSDKLIIQFKPNSSEEDFLSLLYKDISEFAPFTEVANLFAIRNQKIIKHSEQINELKEFVRVWKEFILLWRDLLMIYYLHSCVIEDGKFTWFFDIPDQEGNYVKFKIQGDLQNLFSTKELSVGITKLWSPSSLISHDDQLLLLLDSSFDGKNNLVKKLTIK